MTSGAARPAKRLFFVMSVTVTSQPVDQQDRSETATDTDIDDPVEWFRDEIVHDPETCSNCYVQIRRRHDDVVDNWAHVETWHETLPTMGEGETHIDPPDTVASVYPLARQRQTCLDCGSVGARASETTLSERELVSRASQLATRLQAKGYDLRENVLRRAIKLVHSRQDVAGDSTRVLATAAKVAIQH